jgi:2-iminobutanoate/2-iminopropanoate deaminase
VAAPIGPYTPIVRAGNWLICSGQLGAADGELADGIEAQVVQAIQNVAELLSSEGASLVDVVKTTVYLVDMSDYAAMNAAYLASLDGHRPARSAVAVAGLPTGARVEIEAWAYLPQD